jgi:tetratricopeptide (TPR) repeat protein
VLRDEIDVPPDTPELDRVESVDAHVRAIDSELEAFLPFYLHLLSMTSGEHPLPEHLDRDELRFALREALTAILTLSARRVPLVVLLEDWHWADEPSRAVLNHLAGIVPAYPLLVVVTFRTEDSFHGITPLQSSTIHLGPLSREASLAVMTSLLEGPVPEELASVIHERADGNPFFIEETCRSMVENARPLALEHALLPDTVQAVVRARLDRLEVPVQEVARVAAVAGREFTAPLLERVVSDKTQVQSALVLLVAFGLVQLVRVVPAASYRFKHVVTQEVAYESLVQRQRARLHEQVGLAWEQLYPDRAHEQPELMAHHFSRGENWTKAIEYGLASVRRTRTLGEPQEALDTLEDVHSWFSKLPEEKRQLEILTEILLEKERTYEFLWARDQQEAVLEELVALLEPTGDRVRLADVYRRKSDLLTLFGRFEEAEPLLSQALCLQRELGDPAEESKTLRSMGFVRWQQGRYPEATALNEEALALDRRSENRQGMAADLFNLGSVFRSSGEHERAVTCLEDALRLYGLTRQPLFEVSSLHILALLQRDVGNHEAGMVYLERAERIIEDQRLPGHHRAQHSFIKGDVLLAQGKLDECLTQFRDAAQLARRVNSRHVFTSVAPRLIEVLLALGRDADALPYIVEAAEAFAHLKDPKRESDMWSKAARLLEAHPEKHDEAVRAWERFRELRHLVQDPVGELEALENIGRLARAVDPVAALGHFEQALTLANRLGLARKAGQILNSMAIIEWTLGRYHEALPRYEGALRLFQQLDDPEAVGLLLNSVGVMLKILDRPEAEERLRKAVEFNRQNGQQLLEGQALAALGDLATQKGRLEEAFERYQTSLEIRRAIGDRKGEGWMLLRSAQVQRRRGSVAAAEDLLSEAATAATGCEDPKLREQCIKLQAEWGH